MYEALIDIARRDEGAKVRIIWYKDDVIEGIVENVAELSLCSDNLIQMMTKFTASMHRLVVKGLADGAKFEVIEGNLTTAEDILKEVREISCPSKGDDANRRVIDEIHMLVADFLDESKEKRDHYKTLQNLCLQKDGKSVE